MELVQSPKTEGIVNEAFVLVRVVMGGRETNSRNPTMRGLLTGSKQKEKEGARVDDFEEDSRTLQGLVSPERVHGPACAGRVGA